MKISGQQSVDGPPAGYDYPLSPESVKQIFGELLLASELSVRFSYCPNTSDVLILSSGWDFAIDLWSLHVIASRESEVKDIREALTDNGIARIKEWLIETHEYLHENPDVWSYNSLMLRFERRALIFDKRRGARPFKRPPPQWWLKGKE